MSWLDVSPAASVKCLLDILEREREAKQKKCRGSRFSNATLRQERGRPGNTGATTGRQ